jgi:hypothetical protein
MMGEALGWGSIPTMHHILQLTITLSLAPYFGNTLTLKLYTVLVGFVKGCLSS